MHDAAALRALAERLEDHKAHKSDQAELEAIVLIKAADRIDGMARTLRAIEDIVKVRMYRGRTEPFLIDIQRAIHAVIGDRRGDI